MPKKVKITVWILFAIFSMIAIYCFGWSLTPGSYARAEIYEINLPEQELIEIINEIKVENSISNGLWISTQDSLSTVEINGNNWVFKYVNEKTDLDDHYEYLITESVLDKQNAIINGSLILTNKSDTLEYEIDYITEQNVTLIYIPRGNFHHYQKKE